MSIDLFILLVVIIGGFVVLGFLVISQIGKMSRNTRDETMSEWLAAVQRSLDTQTSTVSQRLDTAARVVGDLKQSLGEMSEVGRGIRELQDFLQSPKLRGNIGESVLRDMIGQAFPKNSFHLQYAFRSGVRVDAVLKTEAGLLCIDSKFPMENFSRMHRGKSEADRAEARREFQNDIRKHIGDISRKYILPEEGTMDFALMYIPSEAVYYEVASSDSIMDIARKHRVYPVSPNTLYAHLQVLLLSFQGKELEQKSREVFRILRALQKDYSKVEEHLSVLSRHVGNAYNTMSAVTGSFTVLGQKLSRTRLLGDAEESPEDGKRG